jgi:hypothetical protein
MSEETFEDLPLAVLEKFVVLWESVKESASIVNIDKFKARRNRLRDFIKLFPCLSNKRIEVVREAIRERKINDILEN